MSQTPPVPAPAPAYRRHALGWPAGSVRSLLALGVLGLLWAVALFHTAGQSVKEAQQHLPAFLLSLEVLMVLILVHFFTAHGKTIGRHVSGASPLHVPSGSVRFVLMAGYIGLCVLLFYNHANFELPEHTENTFVFWLLVQIVVVMACYFAGVLISKVVHVIWGDPPPAPYQDLEAWAALLAVVGLGVIVLLHLINGSTSKQLQIPLDYPQAVTSGLIAIYFGARS
jgi:hypothetical protein